MFDLIVSILTMVTGGAGGLLFGAGLRGRLRFRAEPVCCMCGTAAQYEPTRGFGRCIRCGANLLPIGLLYFRRRWIWSFLVLGIVLVAIGVLVPPVALLTRRLMATTPPEALPGAAWFLHASLALPLLPGTVGLLLARGILGSDSPREPLCGECSAPLDPGAIFDAGACSACGQTFLDAGAPRPKHRSAFGSLILAALVAATALGTLGPSGFRIEFP